MDKEELQQKIRQSWSRKSAKNPDGWSPSNPAYGQCLPTAILVKAVLGGDIMQVEIETPDGQIYDHFYNILPTAEKLDMTFGQYPEGSYFLSDAKKYSPPSQVRRLIGLLGQFLG